MNTSFVSIEPVSIARQLTGFVASCITAHTVATLTLIVVGTYLWWWLAALAALISGIACGVAAGAWAATTGCDAVSNATSWLRRRFA